MDRRRLYSGVQNGEAGMNKPTQLTTMTRAQFSAWRESCDPLWIDIAGDRVHLHIEPDTDLPGAYEALQAVFCRLLAFEAADLRKALNEDY